jgi:hypothetical protein
MFHDLAAFNPVQVDIKAGRALMRPLGGEEDEVALPGRSLISSMVLSRVSIFRSRRNAPMPSATPGS